MIGSLPPRKVDSQITEDSSMKDIFGNVSSILANWSGQIFANLASLNAFMQIRFRYCFASINLLALCLNEVVGIQHFADFGSFLSKYEE